MDRTYPRFLSDAGAREIAQRLFRQQYLHPHQKLSDALRLAGAEVGFCAGAAAQAVRWLRVDDQRSIGRFRSTELTQLANSINRYWQETLAATPAHQAV